MKRFNGTRAFGDCSITRQWRRPLLRAAGGYAALAISLVAAPLAAQTPEDKAASQAVFEEAQALMAAGKTAEACARYEETLRLDGGMSTQFRLGECYEKLGRLASAWVMYVDVANAASAAQLADREKFARDKAAAIKPRLATLTVAVPDAVAAIPGFTLERDGKAIGRVQWGAAVPVDPGTHRVVATAPGRASWSKEVAVQGEATATRVDVPVLVNAPGAADRPGTAAPRAPESSIRGPVGLVIGGVGVAAMAVGVGVGVAAKSKYDGAGSHCQGSFCDAEGLSITDSARTQGTAATVVFVVGAAALVGGGVIWLTAPSSGGGDPAGQARGGALRIGVTASGLALGGTW
jgi:hypothetical protein